jgi:L-rhamnose mutarotase
MAEVQRHGMTILLKDDPEIIERYEYHHAHCWPEVVEGLATIGILNMWIFRRGRRLFMYYEATPDFDTKDGWAKAMDNPEYRRWEDLMNTMQERAPEASPDEWWAEMPMVFDLHS